MARFIRPGRGPDFVHLGQRRFVQLQLDGPLTADELLDRSRTNNRRRDGGIMQQPREGNVGGLLTKL